MKKALLVAAALALATPAVSQEQTVIIPQRPSNPDIGTGAQAVGICTGGLGVLAAAVGVSFPVSVAPALAAILICSVIVESVLDD